MEYEDLMPEMHVRVINFDGDYDRPEHWSEEGDMDEWQGVVVTISEVHSDFIYIHEDEGEWSWYPWDFEPYCSLDVNNPNLAYKRKKSSDFMEKLSNEWKEQQKKVGVSSGYLKYKGLSS